MEPPELLKPFTIDANKASFYPNLAFFSINKLLSFVAD